MSTHVVGGILRVAARIANTAWCRETALLAGLLCVLVMPTSAEGESPTQVIQEIAALASYTWDFGRDSDTNFDRWPDGWKRVEGARYPSYVKIKIVARDPEREAALIGVDTTSVRLWPYLRRLNPSLPNLPPSVADALVNRYLRIELDGGQVNVQSPPIKANRKYQYRFSCQMMTHGLRHDSVRVEFVFLDKEGNPLQIHSSSPMKGTNRWTKVMLDLMRPPVGAEMMMVRLIVEGSEDGLEDIHGTIGFDDLKIEQYPQLRVFTDKPLGIYSYGRPVVATARIMGLPAGASTIRFRVYDSSDNEVAKFQRDVERREPLRPANEGEDDDEDPETVDTEVSWNLPRFQPGFYRVAASLESNAKSTLATETTFAVIDRLVGGLPHGSFGWTLPNGNSGITVRDFVPWLSDLGVAWVKYPAWLAPEDLEGAEEVATIVGKLQDAGIQTVGMLDVPPEDQISKYGLRGRRDMVAAHLFRNAAVWQPLLEPVMTRLTLKVRTWQLGADRDHSFLGRPRLKESITQIADGLQGFGQPIDAVISWPWMESELPNTEASWKAICRSSDPTLSAKELDAFLSLSNRDHRLDGPRTWLLLDPIPKSQYDRDARIRDMVLRMATVRSHRAQAAFVSRPRDPETGLLKPNGRPDELLLPWRTTSRLIGNLKKMGSLQLSSGAENIVFANNDRAVLMLWSAEPTEELIYLGDNVQAVDVWGKATNLRLETGESQPAQRLKIGRLPIFIVGADPTLLAFRMSVRVDPNHVDSFLGQKQKLSVAFVNPTRDNLVGDMIVKAPEAWTVQSPQRSWESLGGRSIAQKFTVVLNNTATIGKYDLPIQFQLETVPPKVITVHRSVHVGPEGLDVNVVTRLVRSGELKVRVEFTNRSLRAQSYDCMLFKPGREYQRLFLTIKPGETIRRDMYWPNGKEMIGQQMLLRADEQNGPRILNYKINVIQ